MTAPRVIVVDPAHRVPFYDRSLATALDRAGVEVTLATAPLPYYEPPQHAPGVRVEHHFGRAIGWLDAHGLDPASNVLARRAARALSYGPELAAFCFFVTRAFSGARSGLAGSSGPGAPLIVHSQWSLAPRLDAAAWRDLRRRGIPVVYTAHNVLPHEHGHDQDRERRYGHEGESDVDHATRARWRRLYASVDRVIVHSEATKRRLLSLGGIPDSVVRVISMPADTWPIGSGIEAGASSARDERADARVRLDLFFDVVAGDGNAGLNEVLADVRDTADLDDHVDVRDAAPIADHADVRAATPIALFFGHIRPYKGLDILLDAWPEVVANLPSARLLVVGPIAQGGEKRLRQDVEARGLGDTVILRLGYAPTDRISDHFAAADVVVLPYLDTDDSAVLATALGHGRASIASAVGGLPEALSRGGGMLVPPGDAPALAAALIEVLGDNAVRDLLEAEARASAVANGWDAAAQATIEIYDELIEECSLHALYAERAPIPADALVSVLMPARDAARHIAASIDGLLSGDWPAHQLELIVAEGRSTDGTRELIERIAGGDDRIRIVDNPTGGTAAGLNAALRAATGDVIVRLDAHAFPEPNYVLAAVEALQRTGAWVVGGPMVGRGENAFGQAVAITQSTRVGSGGAAYRHGLAGPADTVYLGAWPRGVLDFVGGWDEALSRNQDAELCLRIHEAGGLLYLDPAIRTTTITRGTPIALARQYVGYGAGRAATIVRHPRSLALRQAVPAALVATLVGLSAGLLVSLSRFHNRPLEFPLEHYRSRSRATGRGVHDDDRDYWHQIGRSQSAPESLPDLRRPHRARARDHARRVG